MALLFCRVPLTRSVQKCDTRPLSATSCMTRRRLSDQQKKRIATMQESRRRRASVDADSEVLHAPASELPGRVVVRHGRNLVLRAVDGRLVPATFRANVGEVVCGDEVVWVAGTDGDGVVVAVSPRRNALVRPVFGGHEKAIAANLSLLVVVIAPEPAPSGYLIDQYLVAAERIGIAALICCNKADLFDATSRLRFRERLAPYEQIGYPVIELSARGALGLAPLHARMRNQTSILVGQSGVGKSSLVNALVADDLALAGKLSDATGQGRHTTSAATLYPLATGGELIDSPGVRSFRLGRLTQQQLERGFREFLPYLGQCRFDDCAHGAEPACAVGAAVEQGHIHPSRIATFRRLLAASLARVDYGDH